jgi:hypothetical protein
VDRETQNKQEHRIGAEAVAVLLRYLILAGGFAVCATSCRQGPAERPAETPPSKAEQPAPSIAPSTADQNVPQPVTAPKDVRGVSPIADADMSPEFSSAFKDSKECRGIQLSAKGAKTRGDFKIYTSFAKADTPEMEEQWLWTVFDTRHDATGELRAAGRGESVSEAVRDLCTVTWDTFNAARKGSK